MRYPINDRFVLQRRPVGPLVPWLRGLAEALNARKYSHDTIHQQLRRIVLFSEWLEQQQIELPSLSSEDVTQYLRTRSLRSQQLSARPSLRHLMDYLRCVGVISPEEPVRPPTPAERCVQEYAQYLREQRDLADGTIVNYAIRARNFLQHRFGNGEVVLSQLNAGDLIAFVRHETARLTSRGSMKSVTGSLRAFLRYVHAHAARMPDLAHQVPTVAGWAMTSVPRGIAADQVQKMLTSVDRSTPVGRRDYAILLLLSRLGLRASEIAFLTLNDVDWRAGTLTVTLKGGRRSVYPLTEQIGEAIADYLQNGRPESNDRRVFLRTRSPFRGFRGGGNIGDMVRYRLEIAGVDSPTRGTHQFRHGLATQMLHEGASLGEIGDVLGHRYPNTTRIYSKVDIGALRPLALPWPGGVQ